MTKLFTKSDFRPSWKALKNRTAVQHIAYAVARALARKPSETVSLEIQLYDRIEYYLKRSFTPTRKENKVQFENYYSGLVYAIPWSYQGRPYVSRILEDDWFKENVLLNTDDYPELEEKLNQALVAVLIQFQIQGRREYKKLSFDPNLILQRHQVSQTLTSATLVDHISKRIAA